MRDGVWRDTVLLDREAARSAAIIFKTRLEPLRLCLDFSLREKFPQSARRKDKFFREC